MSAAVRAAVAAAANTVEGVTCSPYYVQGTSPGTAMVRLDRITYPNRFGGVATWQVWVVLPQGRDAAEKWLDSKVPDLVAALTSEMTVQSVTPSQLQLDGNNVPGVVIAGTRETESEA